MPPEPVPIETAPVPALDKSPVIVTFAVPLPVCAHDEPDPTKMVWNAASKLAVVTKAALASSFRFAYVRPVIANPRVVLNTAVLPGKKVVTLLGAAAPNGFAPALCT